jgi:NAD+ synthase (glutamine-hydrolysing)
MRLIRIALCTVNTTVGAVDSNLAKILTRAREAAEDHATVAVFPEQIIAGYAPEDLVQWRAFVAAQWTALEAFARGTASLSTVFALGLTVADGPSLYNCAAVVHGGKILGLVPKEKLPTYNVFYEARTLAHGRAGLHSTVHGVPLGDLLFDFDFGCLAVEVCEDIWSPDGPMRRRSYAGAELVLNLSASPYRLGVYDTRKEMIATRASDNQVAIAYVNIVGANDGLIFDGGGFVSQGGRLALEAPRFREGVFCTNVDLDRTLRLRTENTTWRSDRAAFVAQNPSAAFVAQNPAFVAQNPAFVAQGAPEGAIAHVRSEHPTKRTQLNYPVPANQSFFLPIEAPAPSVRTVFAEELLDALALGIGDYFEKTGAFKTIGVALSGGRDSLLCLILARRYVDRRFAHLDAAGRDVQAREILRGFFMPTRYSSAETRAAAKQTAEDLCVPYAEVSIDDSFEQELKHIEAMLQPGETITGLARQNIQARVRAQRMWTWANSAGGLFLQTSNMSEKAVGYTTIGGDMEGALSVIANVPKTVVNYLLDYLLETTKLPCIALTLKKPASAELADNQEDEKDLMPFPVLDACFALYAGEKMDPSEVVQVICAMFPKHEPAQLEAWARRFARLFSQSIYKWVQMPLCLHVGNLDLDRERALQLPVVQRTEWHR